MCHPLTPAPYTPTLQKEAAYLPCGRIIGTVSGVLIILCSVLLPDGCMTLFPGFESKSVGCASRVLWGTAGRQCRYVGFSRGVGSSFSTQGTTGGGGGGCYADHWKVWEGKRGLMGISSGSSCLCCSRQLQAVLPRRNTQQCRFLGVSFFPRSSPQVQEYASNGNTSQHHASLPNPSYTLLGAGLCLPKLLWPGKGTAELHKR